MTDDKRMTAADVKKQVNTWIKKHDLPIDSSAKVDLYELLKMAVEAERERWNADLIDLHWMARRYADGRQSYATSLFNDIARRLIAAGIKLNQCDGTLFARDAMGRGFDGLTDEEAATAKDDWWSKPANGEELNHRITELEAERERIIDYIESTRTTTQDLIEFIQGRLAS